MYGYLVWGAVMCAAGWGEGGHGVCGYFVWGAVMCAAGWGEGGHMRLGGERSCVQLGGRTVTLVAGGKDGYVCG